MGSDVSVKIGYLVQDAVQPRELARFWCNLLGTDVDTEVGDGEFIVLATTDEGYTIVIQRVPESKSGKNRVHLDLIVEDLEAATEQVTALGGTWTEPGLTREVDGYRWRVMSDPEGNEFDLQVQPPSH